MSEYYRPEVRHAELMKTWQFHLRRFTGLWRGEKLNILARRGEKYVHETGDIDPVSSFGFEPPTESTVPSGYIYVLIEKVDKYTSGSTL